MDSMKIIKIICCDRCPYYCHCDCRNEDSEGEIPKECQLEDFKSKHTIVLTELDKKVLAMRKIKKGIKITFPCPTCGGKIVLV